MTSLFHIQLYMPSEFNIERIFWSCLLNSLSSHQHFCYFWFSVLLFSKTLKESPNWDSPLYLLANSHTFPLRACFTCWQPQSQAGGITQSSSLSCQMAMAGRTSLGAGRILFVLQVRKQKVKWPYPNHWVDCSWPVFFCDSLSAHQWVRGEVEKGPQPTDFCQIINLNSSFIMRLQRAIDVGVLAQSPTDSGQEDPGFRPPNTKHRIQFPFTLLFSNFSKMHFRYQALCVLLVHNSVNSTVAPMASSSGSLTVKKDMDPRRPGFKFWIHRFHHLLVVWSWAKVIPSNLSFFIFMVGTITHMHPKGIVRI